MVRRWGRSRWASSPWLASAQRRSAAEARTRRSSYHVASTPSTRSSHAGPRRRRRRHVLLQRHRAKPSLEQPPEAVGQSARRAARALQALEAGDRTKILQAIASVRAAAPAISRRTRRTSPIPEMLPECARLGLSAAKLRPWRKAWKPGPRRTPFVARPFASSATAHATRHRMAYGWHPTPSTRRFSERPSPL